MCVSPVGRRLVVWLLPVFRLKPFLWISLVFETYWSDGIWFYNLTNLLTIGEWSLFSHLLIPLSFVHFCEIMLFCRKIRHGLLRLIRWLVGWFVYLLSVNEQIWDLLTIWTRHYLKSELVVSYPCSCVSASNVAIKRGVKAIILRLTTEEYE